MKRLTPRNPTESRISAAASQIRIRSGAGCVAVRQLPEQGIVENIRDAGRTLLRSKLL
jgi:hypothetical protein